jgi:hypothetical protein
VARHPSLPMRLFKFKAISKLSGSHSPNTNLPNELYGRISGFVSDNKDLATLCTVSRAFNQEAERVLYASVDLSTNHLLILTWFENIAEHCRRAAFVHTLTFGMNYLCIPMPAYTWLDIIARGLRALVNLKECVSISVLPSTNSRSSASRKTESSGED